jgi:hypothetical protein
VEGTEEEVCAAYQNTAKHLKIDLQTSTELNMSEAELSLAVLEFDRDLDLSQASTLNCLSSLDELVDILGIRGEASLDQYQYTDASEPLYRNTFTSEDRWPI